LNVEMLADLRLQGLYSIPGVPNTTAKTQERSMVCTSLLFART
jgi:hypothetical protein